MSLQFREISTPPQLQERIMERVIRLRRRMAFVRIGVGSVVGLSALFAISFAFFAALQSAAESGFGEYTSLLFTDTGAFFMSWKEFAYSLLDTAPLTELIVLLVGCAALLWVLDLVTQNIQTVVGRRQTYA